jgi:hypothetical protein
VNPRGNGGARFPACLRNDCNRGRKRRGRGGGRPLGGSGPELSTLEKDQGLSKEGVWQALADPASSGLGLKNRSDAWRRIALTANRLALASPEAMKAFLDAALLENPALQKSRMMSGAAEWAFHRDPEAGLAALEVMLDGMTS